MEFLARIPSYCTQNKNQIPLFKFPQNLFKNFSLSLSVILWNSLDPTIKNAESYSVFGDIILTISRPSWNSTCECSICYPVGSGFQSHYKFNHNFHNSLNSIVNIVIMSSQLHTFCCTVPYRDYLYCYNWITNSFEHYKSSD